jgi:phosphoribosylaminoimidazole carboxylase PurE protein
MDGRPKVAIVMGSDSDLPVMKSAVKVMSKFNISFELKVLSAHRTPDAAHKFAETASQRGIKVIIAGAGGAAHLAGVLASRTTVPIIGVPMPTDRAGGIDSLFSIVQMPRGVPVATIGIGSSGAQNAALLAIQILALSDEELKTQLERFRSEMTESVEEADRRVNKWLSENLQEEG